MLIINGTHECGGGRKDFIDEDENCLFRSKFNTFTDNIAELSDCQIGWDQVFLLIDGRNIGFLDLLANDLD